MKYSVLIIFHILLRIFPLFSLNVQPELETSEGLFMAKSDSTPHDKYILKNNDIEKQKIIRSETFRLTERGFSVLFSCIECVCAFLLVGIWEKMFDAVYHLF